MSALVERPRWTCALGGALAAAGALPRVIPIIHSGPGCAANFAWTQNGACGLQVAGACPGLSIPGSNMQEREIVFGGHERLREQIANTLRIMDGDLYFVLTGCIPEVIGDDVEGTVREFAEQPLILAQTAGFKGNSYLGYELALKALFRQVVKPEVAAQPDLVNIWGVPPLLDVFWKGNLRGASRLLRLLGLRVSSFFGPGASLEEIRNAAAARLNIVLSDVYGLEAAELFRDLYGVEYISTPLPLGAAASERFLRAVGQALNLEREKVEAVIEREGKLHYSYVESIIDVYNDMEAQRYAIVVGDANYAFSVADFLAEDMGWLPELVVVTDDLSAQDQQKLEQKRRQRGTPPWRRLLFSSGSQEIAAAIDDSWRPVAGKKYHNSRLPVFVAGSSLERSLAASLGAGHLSLSFPVSNRAALNRGYTGYEGGLCLMEDVINAVIALR